MDWSNITQEKLKTLDIAGTNKAGCTVLHLLAAINTNSNTIQAAIEMGADVNKKDEQGHTPLHYAAVKNSNPDIAILLIKNDADVNILDANGKTAIEVAEYNRHYANKMQRTIKEYLDSNEKVLESVYNKQITLAPKEQAKQAVNNYRNDAVQGKALER